MIRSPKYHQPSTPDLSDNDSQSDLDLDARELDPFYDGDESALDGQSKGSRFGQGTGWQIPMQNLRGGKRRTDAHGLMYTSGSEVEQAESLEGLLGENGHAKQSIGHQDVVDSARKSSQLSRKKRSFLKWLRLPWNRSRFRELSDEDESANGEPSMSKSLLDSSRTVSVGTHQTVRYPTNAISNARYTPWSFIPVTLYNEFSLFINMYFLLVALSQIIPQLRIGYLSTYIAPLVFVVSISLSKEAFDDITRRKRDAEANSEKYTVLKYDAAETGSKSFMKRKVQSGRPHRTKNASTQYQDDTNTSFREILKVSKDLRVGDVVKLQKDQRVPADVVLLKCASSENIETIDDSQIAGTENDPNVTDESDSSGEAFIRTDQLDGETDWKLRLACPLTQAMDVEKFVGLSLVASKPDKDVNQFLGTLETLPDPVMHDSERLNGQPVDGTRDDIQSDAQDDAKVSAPLSIDNTAWANTVLASNCTVYGVVVYTGQETRQALSTSKSRAKIGLLEYEINSLTKILCLLTLALSVLLVALEHFEPKQGRAWYISVMRFLVLFSTIVPISMRVNLDFAKSVYSSFIHKDKDIPGTIVRTSTIPEDLGRIEYLLSDKTGTLTQNEMELKRIHIGTVSFANEAMDEVNGYIHQWVEVLKDSSETSQTQLLTPSTTFANPLGSTTRSRREIGTRVFDIVLALALCHNVTPTIEKVDEEVVTSFQASSPDEVAIVRWCESVGLQLFHRDRKFITLKSIETGEVVVRARIVNMFPFTSTSKRMGIIVQFLSSLDTHNGQPDGDFWFYQKGADTVMSSIVAANDWLEEETANMAREGLRTLVVGRKRLSAEQYNEFSARHGKASLSLHGREQAMSEVVGQYLEQNLELLGITGVEDKLQKDVKPSLELLRNAGIKIWMLTGDKVETARCVAVSSRLVARGQHVHTIAKVNRKDVAAESLDFLQSKPDACLLIDGESLAMMFTHFRDSFINIAIRLSTVIACRCSPTQKAEVAKLIRMRTKKRVCCIGDGGNDVSMIQVADVGVGIVGKEGRQASLAADFSITQFCHLTKLLVWHGRNSYKRSAKLAQFVIHRGLIISVCQTVYSIASKFEPIALYRDWLLVGYATVYTMFPVFSLVLDRDVDEALANLYPELYKELTAGRSLSYRTFFVWVFVSIYQGCMIQGLSQLLVGVSDDDFLRMVAVSYTALVLNELLMVAAEVTTWHPVMIASIVGTAVLFSGTVPLLRDYFDLGFVITPAFAWRLVAILAVAMVPPYAGKILRRTLKPPSYRKVRGV